MNTTFVSLLLLAILCISSAQVPFASILDGWWIQ